MAPKYLFAGVAAIGLMGQPALAQNQGATEQPQAQAGQQQLAQEAWSSRSRRPKAA